MSFVVDVRCEQGWRLAHVGKWTGVRIYAGLAYCCRFVVVIESAYVEEVAAVVDVVGIAKVVAIDVVLLGHVVGYEIVAPAFGIAVELVAVFGVVFGSEVGIGFDELADILFGDSYPGAVVVDIVAVDTGSDFAGIVAAVQLAVGAAHVTFAPVAVAPAKWIGVGVVAVVDVVVVGDVVVDGFAVDIGGCYRYRA